MSSIKPFAPANDRSDRAPGAVGTARRRAPLRPAATSRRAGETTVPGNEFQLSLAEGPLRRPALRRASHIRGMLGAADFAAALLTFVAIDRVYADAALLTPATLALVPSVLVLARI